MVLCDFTWFIKVWFPFIEQGVFDFSVVLFLIREPNYEVAAQIIKELDYD